MIDSLIEGKSAKSDGCVEPSGASGNVSWRHLTMGLITRTTRSNLLDVMSMDYVRTARAKGLSQGKLIRRHALGNALIPVLTVIGLGLGNLLGGMVLVGRRSSTGLEWDSLPMSRFCPMIIRRLSEWRF